MPKKTYTRTGNSCRVTFEFPAGAQRVVLLGDFNQWNSASHPMKSRKDGSFFRIMYLKPGAYRYRFLIDDARWENDHDADRYSPNEYGDDDSVIEI